MKKIIIAMVMLVVISTASAQTLNLDNKNVVINTSGKFIVQDNATYRILEENYLTTDYIDGEAVTWERIIVENITKIDELQKEIDRIMDLIKSLENATYDLRNKSENVIANKEKINEIINYTETQRDFYKSQLDELVKRKTELENKITANVVMTPTSFKIFIGVLAFLIIVLIFSKGRKIIDTSE